MLVDRHLLLKRYHSPQASWMSSIFARPRHPEPLLLSPIPSQAADSPLLPEWVSAGSQELFTNAIEHGNLGIGGNQKETLIRESRWEAGIESRLQLPDNAGKAAGQLQPLDRRLCARNSRWQCAKKYNHAKESCCSCLILRGICNLRPTPSDRYRDHSLAWL